MKVVAARDDASGYGGNGGEGDQAFGEAMAIHDYAGQQLFGIAAKGQEPEITERREK